MSAENMLNQSEDLKVKKEDVEEENEGGAEKAEDGSAKEDQEGKDEDAQVEEQLQPTTPVPKSNAAGAQGTPATPGTPGEAESQQSTASTPGPATPGGSQVHIQPYSYPPYSYFAPVPGYAPPIAGMPPGASPSDPYGMAGSNSYQYMDVSNLHDPAPDTRRNRGGVTEPYPVRYGLPRKFIFESVVFCLLTYFVLILQRRKNSTECLKPPNERDWQMSFHSSVTVGPLLFTNLDDLCKKSCLDSFDRHV
jgi:hypothetical protein